MYMCMICVCGKSMCVTVHCLNRFSVLSRSSCKEKQNILKRSSRCPHSHSCTTWVLFVGNNVDIFSLCRTSPRAQARLIKSHTPRYTEHKADTCYHCLAENRHFLSIWFQCIQVCEWKRKKYCVYFSVPTYVRLLYILIAVMEACFMSQPFLNLPI